MTIRKYYQVECNECERASILEYTHSNAEYAAKEAGWWIAEGNERILCGDVHICPKCLKLDKYKELRKGGEK